jgi:hypothetical protein
VRVRRVLSLALLAGAPAAPLAAQAFGVPVSGAPMARGVSLHAMAGLPNAAGEGGVAGMLAVSLGARRAGVTGFLSTRTGRDGDLPDFAGGGASANVKVFGGPLVPFLVQLQGGAAYAAFRPHAGGPRETRWHVPVGLALSWVFPQPAVAVRPWIAPRIDHARVTGPDPLLDPLPGGPVPRATATATEFGLSGGVSFGFLNGLAIDLAYDRVFAAGGAPATFGVGLTYNLR